MLISIFTPSHKPDWLKDLYESLKAQTYSTWEWIILANGENKEYVKGVAEAITENDNRVKIHLTDSVGSIGLLKKEAVSKCTGTLIAEADHDDLLQPNCLEEIYKVAKRNNNPKFIFSDSITCDFEFKQPKDIDGYVFNSDGWKNYLSKYNNNELNANESFEPTARSLFSILYSPDHIRVWNRKAYELSGGYNPNLMVADDHELMIKTYLSGAEFVHIPKPLYIHRWDCNNTSAQKCEQILNQSWRNGCQYLYPLVEEWCRRDSLPMIDLGGAHGCQLNYVPLDIDFPIDHKTAKHFCDITKGLNFPDNSVGCFRAWDFLEHMPLNKIVFVMNELYRCLVPGGWILSRTPAICDDDGRCGRGAFQDPTHVSYWSSNNFWYYTRKEQAQYVPEIKCRFQQVRLFNDYPSEWHRTHLLPYVWSDMCAIKEGYRIPGRNLI